jgi:hypothetical protein
MAWGDFQRQYHATGREKGDGYSPADFDGMTPAERDRARAMMLVRALDGDTVDLLGLRHVGDAGTVATLDAAAALATRLGWRWELDRLTVLLDLTDDWRRLDAFTPYLDGRDTEAQSRAAYILEDFVLPPALEPFVLQRIADGRHEAAILPLLTLWIALRRQVRGFTVRDQDQLIHRVAHAPPGRRPAMLLAAADTLGS